MRLKDKVAIVTGAASGIGKASALVFGREGAKVMCADINAEGAEAVARQIADTSGEAESIRVDVAEEVSVQEMVSATVSRWGRLDVLYNNAGIGWGMPVTQVSVEQWDRLIDINLKGVFLGCKHAIPEMLKNGGGSIVNTASDAGSHRHGHALRLLRVEGRGRPADEVARSGMGGAGHPRELRLPGRDPHADP